MIKKLKIKNLKSIKKLGLNLGKFNVLCGNNASGKTAIIHSILAVAQKYDATEGLDGEIIKIGNYQEVHNRNTSGDIEIIVENDAKETKKIIMKNDSSLIFPKENTLDISFEKDIFYLSSNRIGVVDTYIKGNSRFGTSGLSFANFIHKNQEKSMSDSYIKAFKKKKTGVKVINSLKEHVRYWLEFLTEENINLDEIRYTNQYLLTFKLNTRSINTGSGFSYLLPIIAVCLGALIINSNTKSKPIIIIENPEIYLHPKAQKKLVEFLLFISDFAQVIIETHSDHILKASIENKNKYDKIFVFNLNNGTTEKKEMTYKNFKTKPISYAEVQYKAFDIITSELHIQLYSQLQVQSKKTSITEFDNYLSSLNAPLKNDSSHRIRTYKTLPTYIRNYIDHPENTNRQKYTDAELKQSIEFLLLHLKKIHFKKQPNL